MRRAIFIVVIGLFLLSLRLQYFFNSLDKYEDGQEIEVVGVVGSVPDVGARIQRFVVSSDRGVRVYVSTSSYVKYFYGQRLKLSGRVKLVMLGNKKVINTVSFPYIRVFPRSGIFGKVADTFYKFSNGIRESLIGFYERNLPRNSAAFVSGVVLGVDNGIDASYKDSLINLGVIHVVAASGMNVAIVAGLFFNIFTLLVARRNAVILSIVAIVFYTVLAGAQASIVRAAIMGSIAFGALYFGRQYFGFYALFLTGWMMLFINPAYIEDVGFQLSFVSTFGLLVIPKILEDLSFIKEKINGVMGIVKEDFLLTFSAQLITLPIIFYNFGNYSIVSILVNLLVLWVIPPIMIIGGVAGIVGMGIPLLGQAILVVVIPFLYYFEWVIKGFSSISTSFEVRFSWPIVLAYYFLLGGVLQFLWKRKSKT